MAYSEEAFLAANTPGRGSAVGDFVPGKKGGWVPRNHPDAITDQHPDASPAESGTPQRVQGDPLTAAGGGVGGAANQAGPAGAAMSGLRAAASSSLPGGGMGVADIMPQGASNPNLGQRIYPQAMRQLAMLPRIY